MQHGYRIKVYRGQYAAVRSVHGATQRTSLRTTDLDEARRRLADLERAPAGNTVADLVAIYLRDKDKTAIRAGDLRGSWKNAAHHFGHLRPDQITRDVCRAYTAKRTAQGRKAGTIRKELECVRAAIRFSTKVSGAVFELPAKPQAKERYLSKDEARRLVRAARPFPHVRAFIVLSLCTGARSSALLELTWDRVNLDRRVASLKIGDNLDDQRKNRARVPLNDRACRYLRVLQAQRVSANVIEWGGHPVKSIKRGFAAAAKRAGIEDITPHTLRHTAASWMAEADVPIFEIAKILGHGDTRITERTYAHLRPSHLQTAARSLKW